MKEGGREDTALPRASVGRGESGNSDKGCDALLCRASVVSDGLPGPGGKDRLENQQKSQAEHRQGPGEGRQSPRVSHFLFFFNHYAKTKLYNVLVSIPSRWQSA